MSKPSASSTSAEPDRDETARLPCLATPAPAQAAASAAVVEMLNVDGAVASRSGGVDEVGAARLHRRRVLAHRARAADELVGGLALRAQCDQERGDLRRRQLAVHHPSHRLAGLDGREVPPVEELLEDDLHRRAPRERKFSRIREPSGVSTLSGWNCTPWVGALR